MYVCETFFKMYLTEYAITLWISIDIIFLFGSILAEEFLSSKEKYQQEAKEQTAKTAAKSFNDKERVRKL